MIYSAESTANNPAADRTHNSAESCISQRLPGKRIFKRSKLFDRTLDKFFATFNSTTYPDAFCNRSAQRLCGKHLSNGIAPGFGGQSHRPILRAEFLLDKANRRCSKRGNSLIFERVRLNGIAFNLFVADTTIRW